MVPRARRARRFLAGGVRELTELLGQPVTATRQYMSLIKGGLLALKQPATAPSYISVAKRGIMVSERSPLRKTHSKTSSTAVFATKSGEDGSISDGKRVVKGGDGKRIAVILFCLLFNQGLALLAGVGSKTRLLHMLGFACIAIQWLVFIHAGGIFTGKRTEKYYDLTGSSTFLILTIASYVYGASSKSWRQNTLTLFITIWCVRLGSYLFTRILKEGGIDARFTKVKEDFIYFFLFWNIQGVWTFVTALPVYALNCKADTNNAVTFFDRAGIVVYVIGLLFEIVADYQKSAFRADEKNHGKFIKSGLWSISRHPNYFGEILIHVGIFLVSFSSITRAAEYATIIAPVFLTLLLVFVSGIPPLEKLGDSRWGHQSDYRAYKKDTSVLVPFLKL